MSSSTSSSEEQQWRRCFLGFAGTGLGLGVLLWLVIVLIDPFDTLALSLPMAREPITRNQRFAYPALARRARFDSAITGSSTSLLLDPNELDRDLGGSFVNLSLKLGVPQEQLALLRIFRRHTPAPRTVIVNIDNYWLTEDGGPTPSRMAFPAWMYDENPWNDYAEQFNFYTLRHVPRRLRQSLGDLAPRYRPDGYERFTPPDSQFDLGKVRLKIYGKRSPTQAERQSAATQAAQADSSRLRFDHERLRQILALFPAETEKVLFFPPIHVTRQLPLAAARAELLEGVRSVPNLRVVDCMFASSITTEDRNYWDAVHYNVEIATQLSGLLAASREEAFESEVCRVLLRTPTK